MQTVQILSVTSSQISLVRSSYPVVSQPCTVFHSQPTKCKTVPSPLVLHSLDLFDPRDVGNLALEPGLDLASGQGERQQQVDNLLLGIQM